MGARRPEIAEPKSRLQKALWIRRLTSFLWSWLWGCLVWIGLVAVGSLPLLFLDRPDPRSGSVIWKVMCMIVSPLYFPGTVLDVGFVAGLAVDMLFWGLVVAISNTCVRFIGKLLRKGQRPQAKVTRDRAKNKSEEERGRKAEPNPLRRDDAP